MIPPEAILPESSRIQSTHLEWNMLDSPQLRRKDQTWTMLTSAAIFAVLGGLVISVNALLNLRSAVLSSTIADSQLALARSTADEITALAAKAPSASLGRRPTPGIVAQVGDALVEAGLPIESLTSLEAVEDASAAPAPAPEHAQSDIANPTTTTQAQLRRQVDRLTLEPISMPQLARFLDAWRTDHPEWTITTIQISPLDGSSQSSTRPSNAPTAAPLSPPPLRVHLVMEASYVEGASTSTGATPTDASLTAERPTSPDQPR